MSSLRDKEIVFPPYGADQLADILSEGLILSFKEDLKVMLYRYVQLWQLKKKEICKNLFGLLEK